MVVMMVVRAGMRQISTKHSPLHVLCLIATTALMGAGATLVLPVMALVLAMVALVMMIHVIVAHMTNVTASLKTELLNTIITS